MDVKAFITDKGEHLMAEILTEAYVYEPTTDGSKPTVEKVRALWDTGANYCQITPELARKMGLHSLGQKENNTAGGAFKGNVYRLGIKFGNIHVPHAYFGESHGGGRFDIIIGMNVISHGRFTLEGRGKERTFRFEVG